MRAKYPGKCKRCEEPIVPGEEIEDLGEYTGLPKKSWGHMVCPILPAEEP